MEIFTKDSEIGKEVVTLLQNLIQINTTNPPGNEIKAASFLYDVFSKEGFDAEVFQSMDTRGNIITKLKGSDPSAPKLLILSHLDVVPATESEWEVPPFSGELRGNYIWGRGAIDCKNLVTSEAMALIQIKREGFKPKGDIIYLATADEEKGGDYGAGWMVKNQYEKIKCDYIINEGGGIKLPLGKKSKYLIQVAEKGVFWTKLRTKGVAGHASMPNVGDNALLKMLNIIKKIDSYKIPVLITEPFKQMVNNFGLPWLFRKIMGSRRLARGALNLARMKYKQVIDLIIPLIQMTIAPTVIETANKKENIIPSSCEAILDCRLLPGTDRNYLNHHLKKAIGKKLFSELELIPIQTDPATSSPTDTDLYKKIDEVIKGLDYAELIPFMVPGLTDSRYFRNKGIPAYGFCPLRKDPEMTIEELIQIGHGKNERISRDNLLFETEFYHEIIKRF